MGFIKRSDGDPDHFVDHVFDDVGEVLEEIAEHTPTDEPPVVVEMPGTEPPPADQAN